MYKDLPHNFLAEKMILSCLLINSEVIEITSKTLSSDAFYFKNHQEIYKAILVMYQKKLAIDILTLITFLQENGKLEKIGGVKVLIELISQIPNLIYIEEYLQLVKDKFIRRSLIKLGYETINLGYLTTLPLEIILNNLENQLFNLTNDLKTQNLFSSAELLDNAFFELKEKSLNPNLFGISSGFYDLDSLIQGFQKSDLIILAGRPSMGKTALGLSISLNVLKNVKRPVLFFSLEMSKEQIIYRLLAMEANINQIRLRSGKLTNQDWRKLVRIIKIISKLPLFITDTSDLLVQDIRAKIKAINFEQDKIGLIIIDYLQLMQNANIKSETRVQELSQITRSLKNVAKEFNVPIIVLSQLNRNVENRLNKKPILADLRESGSIEQDADIVLMIYSQDSKKLSKQTSQLIELNVVKHRNGPTGTIRLKFDKTRTKFFNLET